MRANPILLGAVALVSLGAAGRGRPATPAIDAKLKMFAPLPDVMAGDAGLAPGSQIALGRMLYYDARLSKGQDVSCNTCHNLAAYGTDGEATSEGYKKQHGTRNSPTVYNAALHVAQFWDGRAPDLEAQAKGPMMNPVEMAMPSEKAVVAVLKSMPEYVAAFQRAFPGEKDPVTLSNTAKAIGAFERKLITPSRWDRFLKGDASALTPAEKAGFLTFANAGCPACHAGALLGGNLYQKIGVVTPYPDHSDEGRFQVTKNNSDKMMFKVPSLRNVEQTGPYFHNGRVPTLDAAVVQMADYQLGKQLSEHDVRAIVTFLKTLTGKIPAEYIKPPQLPKSTPQTPGPAGE